MWTGYSSIGRTDAATPGNEKEYHRLRRERLEEENKGRGTLEAFDQERETHNKRRESESRE